MKVIAPAKINLYLEVLGRDKNKYHKIETVFQAVGLYDEIILSDKGDENIEVTCCDDKNNVIKALSGKKNIAYKAVLLLSERGKVNKGVKIRINKNIPVAAGLGGGSSDAAAVLSGLNNLWKLKMRKKELIPIARKLGADVPFFLFGHTAMGEGYGDILTPLPRIKEKWILLVSPNFMVKTKWVYDKLTKKIRLTKVLNVNRIKRLLKENIEHLLFNRLEEIIVPKYPAIKKIKKFLADNGASCSLMSGSGPVVFAFVKNEKKGIELKRETAKIFDCSSWLVKTC